MHETPSSTGLKVRPPPSCYLTTTRYVLAALISLTTHTINQANAYKTKRIKSQKSEEK